MAPGLLRKATPSGVCFKAEALCRQAMKKQLWATLRHDRPSDTSVALNPSSLLLLLLACVFGFFLLKTQYVAEDSFELLNLGYLPSDGITGMCFHSQHPVPSSKHRLCHESPMGPPWVPPWGEARKIC